MSASVTRLVTYRPSGSHGTLRRGRQMELPREDSDPVCPVTHIGRVFIRSNGSQGVSIFSEILHSAFPSTAVHQLLELVATRWCNERAPVSYNKNKKERKTLENWIESSDGEHTLKSYSNTRWKNRRKVLVTEISCDFFVVAVYSLLIRWSLFASTLYRYANFSTFSKCKKPFCYIFFQCFFLRKLNICT